MPTLSIIGHGRLGRSVAACAANRFNVNIINRGDAITGDVIVVATPGAEFLNLVPDLLTTPAPVIIASTGFQWPDIKPQSPWIWSANFSLGAQAVRRGLAAMAVSMRAFDFTHATAVTETHHAGKRDAPSATALMFQTATGGGDIESRRIGETLPEHRITMTGSSEDITVLHNVKNRDTFAEGMIWLADRLLRIPAPPGLHCFEKIVDDHVQYPRF